MRADFTPTIEGYSGVRPFRAWVQKVLPQVYDDALSYQELIYKMLYYLKSLIDDVDNCEANIDLLEEAYAKLQEWINDYFVNLDVQEEINNKLDQMAEDGSLEAIIGKYFSDIQNSIDILSAGNLSSIMLGNPYGTIIADEDELPSSHTIIGDYMYIFVPKTSEYCIANKTNVGRVVVADLANNAILSDREFTLTMNHANSCCYDGNYVYMCPLREYSDGSNSYVTYIYRYAPSVWSVQVIEAGITFRACSYDPLLKKLFFMTNDKKIYTFENDLFVFYADIETDYALSTSNQDMFMYNGVCTLVTTTGIVDVMRLKDSTYAIVKELKIGPFDCFGRYRIGETEGFEYDENYGLIIGTYITLPDSKKLCVILELPWSTHMHNDINIQTSASRFTGNVGVGNGEIFLNSFPREKCINAYTACVLRPKTIGLVSDWEEDNIYLDATSLNLNGNTLTTKHIYPYGSLSVYDGTIVFNESPGISTRGGYVNIGTNCKIKTPLDSLNVISSSSIRGLTSLSCESFADPSIITINSGHLAGKCNLYVGGNIVQNDACVIATPNDNIGPGEYAYVDVTCDIPVYFSTQPTILCSIFSTPLSEENYNNFVVSVSPSSLVHNADYTWSFQVTIHNASESNYGKPSVACLLIFGSSLIEHTS